jgi:predicted transposase/invertase (TIGR01784 family)
MVKKVNTIRELVKPDRYLEEERLREKAIRDEASALRYAKEKGIKIGERKASIEFAYKLLMSGKMTHQEIIELTELTEEDLQDIMEKNGKTE